MIIIVFAIKILSDYYGEIAVDYVFGLLINKNVLIERNISPREIKNANKENLEDKITLPESISEPVSGEK